MVGVSETSVKTGAPEGKELPTATVLASPLTEIAAVVALCDAGVDARPTRVVGGRFLTTGFAVDPRLEGDAGLEGDAEPETHPVPPVPVEALPQAVICW
jgi:hypothetical protein